MSIVDTDALCNIAMTEFPDIVLDAFPLDVNNFRIALADTSFIDVWFSLKLRGRYSYHWERLAFDGTIYRHDNAPHHQWRTLASFPSHFHNGAENVVEASDLPEAPADATRAFLRFAREHMKGLGNEF